jgi:hypothetical protein
MQDTKTRAPLFASCASSRDEAQGVSVERGRQTSSTDDRAKTSADQQTLGARKAPIAEVLPILGRKARMRAANISRAEKAQNLKPREVRRNLGKRL